jgi:hypothetical protein
VILVALVLMSRVKPPGGVNVAACAGAEAATLPPTTVAAIAAPVIKDFRFIDQPTYFVVVNVYKTELGKLPIYEKDFTPSIQADKVAKRLISSFPFTQAQSNDRQTANLGSPKNAPTVDTNQTLKNLDRNCFMFTIPSPEF